MGPLISTRTEPTCERAELRTLRASAGAVDVESAFSRRGQPQIRGRLMVALVARHDWWVT